MSEEGFSHLILFLLRYYRGGVLGACHEGDGMVTEGDVPPSPSIHYFINEELFTLWDQLSRIIVLESILLTV
jgi:hypothetical protein